MAMAALRWARRVCATDGSSGALDLLSANLHLNAPRVVIERVKLAPLVWGQGEQLGPLLRHAPGGFDVILGADVVYSTAGVQQLFPTIAQLLGRWARGGAGGGQGWRVGSERVFGCVR